MVDNVGVIEKNKIGKLKKDRFEEKESAKLFDEKPKLTTFEEEEQKWIKNVYQGDKMPEWTPKVFVIGALLAVLMVVFNIYMGLKTGWGEGGSIIAVILGFAIVKAMRKPYSPLENNMTQTMASAGGSIGNVVNVIPALFLLASAGVIARAPTWYDILLWVFFTSFLGVFFAIPLRKQIIVMEKLRFPTGTACAETIRAMHCSGATALNKAKMLGGAGFIGGIVTWFRDGVPALIPSSSYLPASIAAIKGISMKSLTLGLSWSPMMFGAGFLVGPRVGTSMFVGSIISFGVIAPFLFEAGVLSDIAVMLGKDANLAAPTYPLIVKWTMWPGLAIMISYGITCTAFQWKVIKKALSTMLKVQEAQKGRSKLDVSFNFWLAGITLASIGVIGMLYLRFDVPVWVGILVLPISFVLSAIAVRATGETDINPTGAMGSITQIAFGAMVASPATSLLTGGVAAGGASESADMMQDLKTGYILGATPKKQTYIQLIGVTIGALVAVPIFMVLINAYGIGSERLPAPAAITWSGLAQMMANGFDSLPAYADLALAIGVIIGVSIAFLESSNVKYKAYLPSAVGLGVACVVPAIYAVSMCLGSTAMWLINKKNPDFIREYAAPIGAGALAGEGLVGVLCAILVVMGII